MAAEVCVNLATKQEADAAADLERDRLDSDLSDEASSNSQQLVPACMEGGDISQMHQEVLQQQRANAKMHEVLQQQQRHIEHLIATQEALLRQRNEAEALAAQLAGLAERLTIRPLAKRAIEHDFNFRSLRLAHGGGDDGGDESDDERAHTYRSLACDGGEMHGDDEISEMHGDVGEMHADEELVLQQQMHLLSQMRVCLEDLSRWSDNQRARAAIAELQALDRQLSCKP